MSPPRTFGLKALILSPAIWAIQFLIVYVGTAIHCAKFPHEAFGSTRLMMASVSGLALVLIIGHGTWSLSRFWDAGRAEDDGEIPAPQARRERFVAFAAFLLAIVSALATIFSALPMLVFERCT